MCGEAHDFQELSLKCSYNDIAKESRNPELPGLDVETDRHLEKVNGGRAAAITWLQVKVFAPNRPNRRGFVDTPWNKCC